MPSTSDEREFGIFASQGARRTQLDVRFTATFTAPALPVQCRFSDRAAGQPFEDSRHEIRVLAGTGVTTPALLIGVQLRGESVGAGFALNAEMQSSIVPPAVDDDPSFPRRTDHTVLRKWTQTAEAGAELVKHAVTLEVGCDALGEYTLAQQAVVQTLELIEVTYTLSKNGATVGTGSIRMTTRASVEGGLVLLPPAVDDKLT
ncbi:MAG: hypothetical protein IAG13_35390 [Deltaproteobacteria bacterium]|nr:hypothetical protein [Nannocystaceae bacterium]